MKKLKTRRHFTITELVVIIFCLIVLAVLLIPTVHIQVRGETAPNAACINNLGQIAKAISVYETNNNDFIPAFSSGWEYAIAQASGVNVGDNDVNKLLESSIGRTLLCPADANDNGAKNKRSYSFNMMDHLFHPYCAVKLGSNGAASKSTSNTTISGCKLTFIKHASSVIMIGENTDPSNNIGTSVSDYSSTCCASPLQQQYAILKKYTSHNGASELYCDGHVTNGPIFKTISETGASNVNTFKKQTSYSTSSKYAKECWGDWSNCNLRKRGSSCTGTSCN